MTDIELSKQIDTLTQQCDTAAEVGMAALNLIDRMHELIAATDRPDLFISDETYNNLENTLEAWLERLLELPDE